MISSAGRIATLDGLRGIAILLVVWYHIWQITWLSATVPLVGLSLQPLAETGWLGVELFFFISGFVLMLPHAEAHLAGAPPPGVRHFFARRFLKIVPSYVLCIAVLLAVGYQTYPTVADAARDVAFHLLFIHNWFGATYGTIDGVMWSLGVEVQFYVLFPLIAYAFVRAPLRTAAVLIVLANGWRIWALHAGTFFLGQREAQLPAFIDLFAIGMLCAFAYAALARRDRLPVHPALFGLLMVAGFAAFWLLACSAFAIRYHEPQWPEHWKVAWRTVVGLSFGAAALGSLFAPRALQRVLANPPLLFLAAISYNLYLWHQPLARMLLAHRIPPFRGVDPHHDRAWMVAFWFVAIPAALAVSALVTYAFERPLLRLGRRRRTRSQRSTEGPAAPAPILPA